MHEVWMIICTYSMPEVRDCIRGVRRGSHPLRIRSNSPLKTITGRPDGCALPRYNSSTASISENTHVCIYLITLPGLSHHSKTHGKSRMESVHNPNKAGLRRGQSQQSTVKSQKSKVKSRKSKVESRKSKVTIEGQKLKELEWVAHPQRKPLLCRLLLMFAKPDSHVSPNAPTLAFSTCHWHWSTDKLPQKRRRLLPPAPPHPLSNLSPNRWMLTAASSSRVGRGCHRKPLFGRVWVRWNRGKTVDGTSIAPRQIRMRVRHVSVGMWPQHGFGELTMRVAAACPFLPNSWQKSFT